MHTHAKTRSHKNTLTDLSRVFIADEGKVARQLKLLQSPRVLVETDGAGIRVGEKGTVA